LELDSKKVLFEKKAIPENEYLAAQYGYDRAFAGYELVKTRLGKLAITAPHKGIVNDRYYDLGAYATPLTPIFNIINKDNLVISAGVAERFVSDIKKGTPVELSFDAFPELRINDRISYIYNSIDPSSRTFEIEINISNKNRMLKPEMIANLKIERRKFEDQIVIPMDAVLESEDGRYVYLVDENQARKTFVNIVAIYQDSILVDGLKPQDNLIMLGQQELTDGDEIEIIN
jgi:RND family efflux transporter MFP subunit